MLRYRGDYYFVAAACVSVIKTEFLLLSSATNAHILGIKLSKQSANPPFFSHYHEETTVEEGDLNFEESGDESEPGHLDNLVGGQALFPESSRSRSSSPAQSTKTQESGGSRVLNFAALQHRQERRLKNAQNMSSQSNSRGKVLMTPDAKKKMDELTEALAKARKEKENLQELLQKKRKKSKTSNLNVIPISTEMQEAVFDKTGTELWRTCKFLATPKQQDLAMLIVMRQIPAAAKYLPPEGDELECQAVARNFNNTYGTTLTKRLNALRNQTQSGLGSAYVARAKKNLVMPNPKQFLQIVMREGLQDDGILTQEEVDQHQEWFMWYWDHCLVKIAGQKNWGQNVRRYCPISSGHPADDPKKKYITSSHEAFLVLCYENCGQRFPYMAEKAMLGKEVNKMSQRYQSKYTRPNVGQQTWGGWDAPSRYRYIELVKAIKKAKREPHVAELERTILLMIQLEHNIVEDGTGAPTSATEPEIFETDPKYHADFGVESDEETGSLPEVVLQEFEEVYRDVPTKKDKKKKRSSLSAVANKKRLLDADSEDEQQKPAASPTTPRTSKTATTKTGGAKKGGRGKR